MKNFLLLLLAFFLTSCVEPVYDLEDQQQTIPEFQYSYGNEVNRNFYGQVLDRSGNPVSGATVSAGSSTVQTNTKGFFILKDAPVKEKFAHLKVTKAGFVNASRVLFPTSGDNRVNIMMIPATTTSTISTGTASSVSLPDGTLVKFDGNFKDSNGNPYSGNVNVAVFNLKTSDTYFNETMPGSLLASNSEGEAQMLESFGMMHVQLTGTAGQDLQIVNTAQITYPIDPSQISTAPATIPLWSFNEEMGIWIEEGKANKIGNKYVGNVSHFSWWNCDVPNDYANLSVTITDSNGQPLTGLNVGLKTASMTYEVNGLTNGSGVASGMVIANQTLEIKVYDLCGNVVYSGNIGPFTNASANNLSVTVPNTTAQSFTITGTLQNCSNANVTDGFVELDFPSSTNNFFQNNIQSVSSGSFSFTTIVCTSSPQFTLTGYDITSMQTSGAINFTGTLPITNVGTITTCSAVNEFLTYQIDNQSAIHCLAGFNAGLDVTVFALNHTSMPGFAIFGNNILTTGTYTSGFTFIINPNNPSPVANGISADTPGNNLTLIISNFDPVGGYIDFTLNGTFLEPGTTNQHTISATGHVIRDY